MSHTWRIWLVVAFATCAIFETAIAEVPNTLNFQGRMKDSTGTPFTGAKLVKFTIYDGTGTEIWNSGFNSTTFADGLITVQLGAPPHPVLPTGSWLTDTALTLGITVGTDPEISPRIPFTSTGYAFHAGTADSLTGFDAIGFVRIDGDTMSGPLSILSQPGWMFDSAAPSLMINSHDKASHLGGDGLGDFRIGSDSAGFSIGIDTFGGGGYANLWTQGTLEFLDLGSTTSGIQLRINGVDDIVSLHSNVAINTTRSRYKAGLTIHSQNQWRWDVDSGNGDFFVGNSSTDLGLRIGVATAGLGAGSTRFWTDGGLINHMTFGSPVAGDVLRIDADSNNVRTYGELGVGTGSSRPVAPLHVRSKNRFRWDIGDGLGDVRIEDGSGGLSIGVAPSGEATFWSTGGTSENLVFGSPTEGEMLRVDGNFGNVSAFTSGFFQAVTPGTTDGIRYFSFGNSFGLWENGMLGVSLDIDGTAGHGTISLNDSVTGNLSQAVLSGRSGISGGGSLRLRKPNDLTGMYLKGGTESTGSSLEMWPAGGPPTIQLFGGYFSDSSVQLPDAAINDDEILNEPGIAFLSDVAPTVTFANSASAQDIITTDITIPADGYVVVDATLGIRFFGTVGLNYVWFQIDTASGGSQNVTFPYMWMGQAGHTSTANYYQNNTIKRVFFLSAGTYTFRMEGNAYTVNNVNADQAVFLGQLQATYYPTSYGSVVSMVATPGDNASAEAVRVTDHQTGKSEMAYKVDLSYYEQQARDARRKVSETARAARDAERTLFEAEERLRREQTANVANLTDGAGQ